jgi:NADH-quinone oxidoreductase subunit L
VDHPALPLLAVALNLLLGDRLGKRGTAWLACGSIGLAFAFAVRAVIALAGRPEHDRVITETLYTWMRVGDFSADVGYLLDPLSAVMVLVVTGVGFLIHVYSTGYMAHDPGFRRFFLYLNLFMFAMLTLVLADNFLEMFVGWEGVGLCSYLLIGFWYERPSATRAGMKAFIVNRIGDFGFILGVLFLFVGTGSVAFQQVFAGAPEMTGIAVTTAALLLFLGATGKSAQLPLYTWLPDAMEGPTPVSALIHAATMVTAGVYMVARCHVVFELSPVAMETVAVIGAATGLFAATIGVAQNDIKRVLAYSTVSQLGVMFFACGVGAFGSGIFHVMTHAFFKALLFLGAGSVIHALSDEQDLRRMGGLAKRLPWTHGTMLIATLAIAGMPPFAASSARTRSSSTRFSSGHYLCGSPACSAPRSPPSTCSACTCSPSADPRGSPMSRAPPSRVAAQHDRPAGGAGGAVGRGRMDRSAVPGRRATCSNAGSARCSRQHRWRRRSARPPMRRSSTPERARDPLMALVGRVRGRGIAVAFRATCSRPELATALRERLAGVHQLLLNKYWVDELYDATIVRPTLAISNWFWRFWDTKIIDGFVNGMAYTVEGVSAVLRLVQTGFVGTYALFITLGVAALILHFLRR